MKSKSLILILTLTAALALSSCGKTPDTAKTNPENDVPSVATTEADKGEQTEASTAPESDKVQTTSESDVTVTTTVETEKSEQPETSAATAVSKSETVKTSAKTTVTTTKTVTKSTTISEDNDDVPNTVDSGEAVEDIDPSQTVQPPQLSEEEIRRSKLLKYYYEALEKYSKSEFGGSYYDDEGNLHILVTDESLIPAETAEGLIYEAVTYSYAKLQEYQDIISDNRRAIGFDACGIDESANKVVIYCGDPLDTDLLYSLIPEDSVKIVAENSDASDL